MPLGDSALLIAFDAGINEVTNRRVLSLFSRMRRAAPPFVRDLVPAYDSLTVHYEPVAFSAEGRPAYEAVRDWVQPFLEDTGDSEEPPPRPFSIPVCYHPSRAPDIEELAIAKGLSVDDVVALHTAPTYRVFCLGFLPGFAYLGPVPPALETARRTVPRQAVPAGSVAVAGVQTGIYPIESPGGWNLIGQTPLTLFSAHRQTPALLSPGDAVRFTPISSHEFDRYQSRLA